MTALAEARAKRTSMSWQSIDTAPKEVGRWQPVDLWMTVYASPLSFGIADAFRVTDCWLDRKGKWVHMYRGEEAELQQVYITHWMPIPGPPEP